MPKKKKKEKKIESPLPKGMTKKKLEKLMNMFCIHVIEYEAGACLTPDVDCDACILRDISWEHDGEKKDLCYAVWHAGVLKNNA